MEKIKIENFAGIKLMNFEFKSINILIGPQGSGKSVTVKLLYFFKSFFEEVIKSIDSEESKRDLDKKQKDEFINYFPKESWPKTNFKITYTINKTRIFIEKKDNILNFDYSDNLKKAILKGKKIYSDDKKMVLDNPRLSSTTNKRNNIKKLRELICEEMSPLASYQQLFIPAGRSFFANIQKNIFSFLNDNRSFDPFFIEFGSFYEIMKERYKDIDNEKKDTGFEEIASQILSSKYHREKEKDFLIHADNRKVNLSNASSGQQETLPLIIILRTLNMINLKPGTTIYIEEPEAHLFPDAQKRIVQLLARTLNNKKANFQIIITTHSPYLLSSFNILLQAGRLTELKPNKTKSINKIVPPEEQIKTDLLVAYSLNEGKKEVLIDKESKLITQTILDGVSDEISNEFGNLLDIEF